MNKKVEKSEEQWKEELTPDQFEVCRNKGTERPFTGEYYKTKTPGIYKCAACGNELFNSDTKFDSGTGWPSFWEPVAKEKILVESDNSAGMQRLEVLCRRCGGHLGHVFNDGPPPTHLRYCINSAAIKIEKKDSSAAR